MGLFSFIGGVVSSIVKKAVPAIASAAAGVISGLFSSGSKNVGRTSSYDNETSSVSETERMNEILSSYSGDVAYEARKNERMILRNINEIYDEIIYKLQIAGILDDYNVEKIKKDREKIEKLCNGGIEKHINKRFSIDDSECLEILKMPKGAKKEKEMKAFSKRVMSKGISILSKELRDCVESDQDLIYSIIREKYNENNAKIVNEKKSYEEMIKISESDNNEFDSFIKKKEEKIKLAKLVVENAQIGD